MSKRKKTGHKNKKHPAAEKEKVVKKYLRQEPKREPNPEEIAEGKETPVKTIRQLKEKEGRGTVAAVLAANNAEVTKGDEVIYDDMRALVCCVHMSDCIDILASNGMVFEGVPKFALKKTGRHFGILRELLDIISQTEPYGCT